MASPAYGAACLECLRRRSHRRRQVVGNECPHNYEASTRPCMHACMRASECSCVHACVRACVRACERARVRACVCVRACVHACVRAYQGVGWQQRWGSDRDWRPTSLPDDQQKIMGHAIDYGPCCRPWLIFFQTTGYRPWTMPETLGYIIDRKARYRPLAMHRP